MSLGTRLFTMLHGELVGTDDAGNRYYRDKRRREGRRERRWVVYNGPAEASRVPAEWHGWLHARVDVPPTEAPPARKPWQAEHKPNLTGTVAAYRPPGDVLRTGARDPATGDYQPWQPS